MPRQSITRLRALVVTVVAATILAACGASSSSTPAPTGTAPAAPASPAATTPGAVSADPLGTPAATPGPGPALPNPPATRATPPPVPQATPITELPNTPEQWAAMELVADEPGVYGFVVLEQDGTVVASINGTTPFITASLYKLILMADILWRIESGMLTLDTTLPLEPEQFGDYGDMYFTEDDLWSEFTIEEYLYAMGAWSSNAAARTLLQLTSPDVLRMTALLIGMENTWLFADPASLPTWPPQVGPDAWDAEVELAQDYLEESAIYGSVNITTPLDMARYQLGIINGTLISPWVSEQVATILEQQVLRDRLPYFLDGDVRVLSKSGDLEDAANDVGVFYLPDGPRAIATMAMAVPDIWRATLIEQRLGLIASGDVDVPPL